MSTRSSSATAASTRRVAPASDAQSPTTATAPSPVATPSTAGSRSLSTSRKPSAASRLAMARPIPPAAPVTTAVEPDAYTSDAARHGEAAVQDEGLPRDPGGVRGQEVGDGAGHVSGHAEAFERVRRRDLLLAALVERGGERRLHHGGGDRVHPDRRAELDRQLLGEVDEHRLAGAVEPDAGRGLEPGDRGDVDHGAAVLAQPRRIRLLYPRERGDAVDLDDLAGSAEVQLDERSVCGVDAGVVDEQVEAAERLDDAAHGVALVLHVVGLAGDGHRVLRSAELLDRRVERLLATRGDADPGSLVDQPLGDPEADAPARAGDERHRPVEPSHPGLLRRPPSGKRLLTLAYPNRLVNRARAVLEGVRRAAAAGAARAGRRPPGRASGARVRSRPAR